MSRDNPKQPTDKEILDWLEDQDCVRIDAHYNPMLDERTPLERATGGYNGRINFFSIPSQHLIDIPTIREAISIAIAMEKEKRR